MFNTYPNHNEVNNLIELFTPVLELTKFKESYSQPAALTSYTAKTNDSWSITVSFKNSFKNENNAQSYNPVISFEKNKERDESNAHLVNRAPTAEEKENNKQKSNELINHFHLVYNPNFERVVEVIKIFLQQGVNMGVYNTIKLMKYDQHSRSHFSQYQRADSAYYGLYLDNKIIAKIAFNNLLQTIRSGENDFKKSNLSLDIIYLMTKNNVITPYFKIKLPYSAHKKNTAVLSLDCSTLYFVNDSSILNENLLDSLDSYPTDNDFLNTFFKEAFRNEVINIISRTLKIKKAELNTMTDEELKNHFILIEMVKI